MPRRPRRADASALGRDPLATSDEILATTFFRAGAHGGADPGLPHGSHAGTPPREPSWRVISISLYPEDIERMDALVAELRRRGHRRANRSQLIRHALRLVDPDKVPRGE